MDTHPVPWAGRNHLALVTDNLEHTTRLWHGVMGAPLVATVGTEAFRPYGFDVGHGATVTFFGYHGILRPPGRPLRQAGRDTRCAGCAV
jgi:hypothetical protein